MEDEPTTEEAAGGIAVAPVAAVMAGAWGLAAVQAGELDRRPSGELLAAASTAVATRSA